MLHKFLFRIYWEDTDGGGIVYYANYLKFCERARTEFLRSVGVEQKKLGDEKNLFFVVRKFSGDLKSPAKLDDLIEVRTEVKELGGASIIMQQQIFLDDKEIFSGEFLIAAVSKELKPARIPEEIKLKLSN